MLVYYAGIVRRGVTPIVAPMQSFSPTIDPAGHDYNDRDLAVVSYFPITVRESISSVCKPE